MWRQGSVVFDLNWTFSRIHVIPNNHLHFPRFFALGARKAYILKALGPLLLLMFISLTSFTSGSEFIAHRKFAFHVLGSVTLFGWPGRYFPENRHKLPEHEQRNQKGKLRKVTRCDRNHCEWLERK